MDKMAIRAKQVTNKETIKDKRQTDKKTKWQKLVDTQTNN